MSDPVSKRRLPSRRQFLIGTGAAVGVTVGFLLWPRRWPNARVPAEGEVLLNAWLSVGTDGRVTVALPVAEMGQGSWTGLAQIAADELGADWRMVGVEPAPWHPAFAHSGLVRLGTDALPPVIRDIAAHVGATVMQRVNLQLTGGSTSIRGYHDMVREAAAAARTLLTDAAAREWGADRKLVDTRAGQVVFKANRMAFGDAVRLVDPQRKVGSIRLRDLSALPLEGKAVPRIDVPAKVDGSARFGGDVRLPGMVYAAIRHGPLGGRLTSATAPAGVTLVKGPNWVATTGVTSFEAERALGRVDAAFAVEGRAAGNWIEEETVAAAGEPLLEALPGKMVEARYQLPFLAHACMEPMVAAARVADGRAEVWGPTQSLTLAHWAVASALGVDNRDVTVHPTMLGGGFGRKAEGDAMAEAALIARAVGKPVMLQWSRSEDVMNDRYRPAAAAAMAGGLGESGEILAWRGRIAVPDVGASFMGRTMPRLAGDGDSATNSAIEGAAAMPYAVGDFLAEHVPVVQPVPLGYWRSVGHSFTGFIVESFVDELADAAGEDPLAFRLKLLADRPRHARVLREAAAAGLWDQPVPAGFGRGIALHESFGSIVATVIEAGLSEGAIRILRASTAIDCGRAINPVLVRQQVEGSTIMGLSAAIMEAVTFADGFVEQRNFHDYPILPLGQSPEAMVTVIVNSGAALGGVGEPAVPPAAPALANALFAATGRRLRTLPLGPALAA